MTTFKSIPDALHHAVFSLADEGHGYILNVRGTREIEQSRASTIQVVPTAFVYEDGDLGLTIHMPFDPASGTFTELIRFLGTQGHELFDRFERDEIPFFAIKLGRDTELATRVLLHMLENVYDYPPRTTFECEVFDEGPCEFKKALADA